ncbi:unnamed protein product [Arctogadus glacialis]
MWAPRGPMCERDSGGGGGGNRRRLGGLTEAAQRKGAGGGLPGCMDPRAAEAARAGPSRALQGPGSRLL